MPKIEVIKSKSTGLKHIFVDGKDLSDIVTEVNVRELAGTTQISFGIVQSELHIYETD